MKIILLLLMLTIIVNRFRNYSTLKFQKNNYIFLYEFLYNIENSYNANIETKM